MRTTIDIDDDVLLAAKARARRDATTLGATVSALLRGALSTPVSSSPARTVSEVGLARGFVPFPARGVLVTNEIIDQLRDADTR